MTADEASTGIPWRMAWELLRALPEKRNEVLAVLNGAVGDRLEQQRSPLRTSMRLLVHGRELDLEGDLRGQLEGVRPRVLVLAHGFMCTESIWTFPNGKGRSFGERLAEDVGVTPVYVRYNSGRHISVNGRELAHALERLFAVWPVPVEEVNVMGYSMGGLVTRSATHYAEEAGHRWLALTERLFLLGVPMRGLTFEQLMGASSFILRTIPTPVTRITAWVLNQRSAGVKDLRHGYIVDEEWQDQDVDRFTFGRQHTVPLARGVHHYVVAGNLAGHEHHPLAKFLGDALVTPYSAKDEGFTGTPSARAAHATRVFDGLSHMAIVNHDAVYDQILRWWLYGPPGLPCESADA
ncbi:MAG: alpha/beta hydrolase [Myxococcales bacterium]|nr:alpha/beta hydrolase [Myxococcales bacterium]MCB9629802.1 alpha/beta hydrolase [Sandaracinaceae bacterium]